VEQVSGSSARPVQVAAAMIRSIGYVIIGGLIPEYPASRVQVRDRGRQ